MLRIDYPFKKEILACGAQHQAGFCLTKKNCAFIINDLGSLDDEAVMQRYQDEIARAKEELKIEPKLISHDLDAGYNSTKYARGLSQDGKDLKYYTVQHHQAHLASCIGENRLEGKAIGVVLDGEGAGLDGNAWGGEFFAGDLKEFRRLGHFKYQAIADGLYSSSAARLFDNVCTMIGLRQSLDFQGQGVLELERIINRSSHVAGKIYEFKLEENKDGFIICPDPVFENISEDLKNNISKSIISTAFHNAVIEVIRKVCDTISRQEKTKNIILTGSVFQNKFLFKQLKEQLTQAGFNVISHRHFSFNDSNISFGQAVLANQSGLTRGAGN